MPSTLESVDGRVPSSDGERGTNEVKFRIHLVPSPSGSVRLPLSLDLLLYSPPLDNPFAARHGAHCPNMRRLRRRTGARRGRRRRAAAACDPRKTGHRANSHAPASTRCRCPAARHAAPRGTPGAFPQRRDAYHATSHRGNAGGAAGRLRRLPRMLLDAACGAQPLPVRPRRRVLRCAPRPDFPHSGGAEGPKCLECLRALRKEPFPARA